MLAVILSIMNQTDQSDASAQHRKTSMVQALNYLYREVNTHVGLKKYENTALGSKVLQSVVSLMKSASLILPIQMPKDFKEQIELDLTTFRENEVRN